MNEYVRIYMLGGGSMDIDVEATEKFGTIEKTETVGDTIFEIKSAIDGNFTLINEGGEQVLFLPGTVTAINYMRNDHA